MIEIAFDKNDNDEFLNSVRPVVNIQNEQMLSFEDYRLKAKQILDLYSGEQIITYNGRVYVVFFEADLLGSGSLKVWAKELTLT